MSTQTVTTGYEYVKVRAPKELESLYRDAYRSFGWSFEGSEQRSPIRPLPLLPAIRSKRVTLSFKRDRGIKNLPMLRELQRTVDASLASVARLERSRTSVAAGWAIVFGVIGAGLLAGSMLLGPLGQMPILLGVGGLVNWVIGAIAYFNLKASRGAKLDARISAEIDMTFDAAEQAARLIR
ncbi:hypothetical protein [Promicromonospora sp. NFX87]|uniref:hypothetical protein n=1 Tax=Promicromonospora sp. NFX87 TaxID=3402691 RepID=UPI003AFA24C0